MIVQAFIQGDLGHLLNAQVKAVEKGGVKGLRRVTSGIRGQIRRDIGRAGFSGRGKGLAGAVRSKVSGKGTDLDGVVYSKAIYPAGRMRQASIDLVQLFGQGTTIRAASGTWLAIPTEYAPVAGGRGVKRRASPDEMQGMGIKLVFLPIGNGRAVAVRREGGRNIVTHVLVRQVSLRKRYDIQSAVDKWTTKLPEIVAQEINKSADDSTVLRRYGG